MASLFGMFNKPKKYKARRDSKLKLEKLIDKDLTTAIATNSEVERQWLEKQYGICVDSENDPIVKMAAELRGRWTIKALRMLGEDEKSQEAAIRALINDIKKNTAMSQKPHETGEEDFKTIEGSSQNNPNNVKRKKLRREMIKLAENAKINRPSAIDNTNEILPIFSELAKKLSSVGASGGGNRTIAVEVDGELIEMSPEAYEVFKKQRKELLAARAKSKDFPQ